MLRPLLSVSLTGISSGTSNFRWIGTRWKTGKKLGNQKLGKQKTGKVWFGLIPPPLYVNKGSILCRPSKVLTLLRIVKEWRILWGLAGFYRRRHPLE
jgi:hypothetical protein